MEREGGMWYLCFKTKMNYFHSFQYFALNLKHFPFYGSNISEIRKIKASQTFIGSLTLILIYCTKILRWTYQNEWNKIGRLCSCYNMFIYRLGPLLSFLYWRSFWRCNVRLLHQELSTEDGRGETGGGRTVLQLDGAEDLGADQLEGELRTFPHPGESRWGQDLR